jgi:hypothetical protein
MKKPLIATIFLVIGIAAGGIVGVYYGAQHIGRPNGRLLVLGATGLKGLNAIQLYKKGEYVAAREAMLEYVKILEDVSKNTEYVDSRISRTDMALAFTRLALLEESQGHNDQANEFMRLSIEEAKHARWKEPTEKNLRRFVEDVDKYSPLSKRN